MGSLSGFKAQSKPEWCERLIEPVTVTDYKGMPYKYVAGETVGTYLRETDKILGYGYESDYTNLLTPGEINTYAGYAGLETSNLTLREMEVYVTVGEGEDLEIGIKTGNKKNDGSTATDNAGWFKVDFFRIHKVDEPTGIGGASLMNNEECIMHNDPSSVYDLQGRKVASLMNSEERTMNNSLFTNHYSSGQRPNPGIYIIGDKKVVIK